MSLKDDLENEVRNTFSSAWDEQKTENIPAPTDLRLNSNHAKNLEWATVLYADLDGSTSMVQNNPWFFSAEVYKSYLRCAAQIIRNEGGVIMRHPGFNGHLK